MHLGKPGLLSMRNFMQKSFHVRFLLLPMLLTKFNLAYALWIFVRC